MARVTIDRLRIDSPGLSEADGRRLAQLVAARLGATAARIDRPIRRETAQAAVPGGGSIDELASQIVEDLLRRIAATA